MKPIRNIGRVPTVSQAALAAFVLSAASFPTPAAAASVKARTPEALWEISRNHLKDPFRWPSVWKTSPQTRQAAELAGGKRDFPLPEGEFPAPQGTAPAKSKPGWQASEEKRTRNYLMKVGPLFAAANRPLQIADPDSESTPTSGQGPATHYLAGPLILSTPFIADPGEGGRMYPGECRIQYASSNESAIIQLYDEVVLSVGKEQGVKPGDIYRTYEVGPAYRSFATGRALGRLVETNGMVEIVRTGTRTSVGRLIRCYGTLSRSTRAAPMGPMQEVTASGYSPLPDARQSAQVVWVTQQQQLPQPFSFAIVDQGARKGFRMGDMILFFNRNSGRMTEKVLGNGLVVSVHEESATVLIQELFPGIINRGDFVVAIQTPVL